MEAREPCLADCDHLRSCRTQPISDCIGEAPAGRRYRRLELGKLRLRHDWGPILTSGRRPDFLFPGKGEYEDEVFPQEDLRLLGAKTSLKERWRHRGSLWHDYWCSHVGMSDCA
ncbi:MAG: type II restriction endonuclease [Dehalococcoidia bacterium]|jgi:hypothetical protein|nr:type II restriction endonuclease [Dehalococcoidia bacterium]